MTALELAEAAVGGEPPHVHPCPRAPRRGQAFPFVKVAREGGSSGELITLVRAA
jgi:hypothetical protein